MAAGVSGADLVQAIDRIASASKDEQADRRRAKDRERQRIRRNLRKSAESADNPSPKDAPPSSEPTVPRSKPHPTPYSPPPFDRFWSWYPHKVGKRAALKAFPGALCRAGSIDAILVGVERAKLSRSWSEGYIPNPATWLNQDRWLDQPDETARGPPITGGMVAAASDELGYRMALERARERDQNRGDHLRDQGVVVALPAPAARSG